MKKINFKNKAEGMSVKWVVVGALVALSVTLIGAGVFAYLLGKGSVSESGISLYVGGIVFFSSFVGSFVAATMTKNMFLLHCGVTAALYIFLLVCIHWLLFSGRFSSVLSTIGLTLLGGAVVSLLKSRPAGKRKWKNSMKHKM